MKDVLALRDDGVEWLDFREAGEALFELRRLLA